MDTLEQALLFLDSRKNILIILPEAVNLDQVAAARALQLALEQQNKAVTIACVAELPKETGFLLPPDVVVQDLQQFPQYTIIVKTQKAPLDQLSYEVLDGEVKIFITPKTGKYEAEDVKFISTLKNEYEALVSIGVAKPEDAGSVYTENTDVFFNVPKIVLDTNPRNTLHGALNVVEVNRVGICELLAEYFLEQPALLTPEIATALLAGIISSTNSFQAAITSPQSLEIAGRLMENKGNQQQVIRYLFKTRSLAQLQLWGRVLARARDIVQEEIMYTAVSLADFQKTTATSADILTVASDTLVQLNNYTSFFMLTEPVEGEILLFAARTKTGLSLESIAAALNSAVQKPMGSLAGFDYATIPIPNLSFTEAENLIIGSITKTSV